MVSLEINYQIQKGSDQRFSVLVFHIFSREKFFINK